LTWKCNKSNLNTFKIEVESKYLSKEKDLKSIKDELLSTKTYSDKKINEFNNEMEIYKDVLKTF
jgi:hypothetical protein